MLAAASQAAPAYLIEAFAVGHTMAAIANLASAIAGHGLQWMKNRLQPIDPATTSSAAPPKA
jgi:hypothetical protein